MHIRNDIMMNNHHVREDYIESKSDILNISHF